MMLVNSVKSSMNYRKDIDGLRALAVLPVVFFHAGMPGFQGGFVGVDIFFVISGFLITSIIAEEIKQNKFSVTSFYERRIRRILPALFTVVVFTYAVSFFLFTPTYFKNVGQSVAATSLFSSNILFWRQSNYFAAPASVKPLLHTWSLAVEEQFYIFFPPLLWIIFRYFRACVAFLIAALALFSMAFNVWMVNENAATAFYLTPYRIWELLIGSALALGLIPVVRSQMHAEVLGSIGLGLIVWSVISFSSATVFPGWAALVPCLGAAALIYSGIGARTTYVGRMLEWRPVVFVGLLSYSLYLWHWPIIVFTRYYLLDEPTHAEMTLAIIVMAALSFFSWKYVEKPFRKKDGVLNRVYLFRGTGGVIFIFVSVGLATHVSGGMPQRFDTTYRHIVGKEILGEGTCFLREDQRAQEWKSDRCFMAIGFPTTALLWGDSFAAHYAAGFKLSENSFGTNILQYTSAQCAPVRNFAPKQHPYCGEFNRGVEAVIRNSGAKTIIMSARWSDAEAIGLRVKDVTGTVIWLRSMGLRVIVIGQSPLYAFNAEDLINRELSLKKSFGDKANNLVPLKLNQDLAMAVRDGGGQFIDPEAVLCKGQSCIFRVDGMPLIWDDGHLSEFGSQWLLGKFIALIKGGA